MYSLKNVKIYKKLSEETTAFNATLYKGTKKVAECSNRGCGGENDVFFFNKEDQKEFNDFLKTLPPQTIDTIVLEENEDSYINSLLDEYEINQENKKQIKKMTQKGFKIVLHVHEKSEKSYTENHSYYGLMNENLIQQVKMKHPNAIINVIHK